jgi:crotonobetainyl-CoA:carnitine CoA-transferase CaiB-like acyl-CoA transferase
MTDEAKALVERLRAKYTVTDEFSTIRRPVNPDGHEAADLIGAQAREIERLREAMTDYWKPDPGDPFWMLEAEDGEWLKNAYSMLGTRDATKAIRFPTERDAYNHRARMTPGYKWWGAKPTEHTWIKRKDHRSKP